MDLATQCIEIALKLCSIETQLVGKPEKREVIHGNRGLHLATLLTVVGGTHGSARPALRRDRLSLGYDQPAGGFTFCIFSQSHFLLSFLAGQATAPGVPQQSELLNCAVPGVDFDCTEATRMNFRNRTTFSHSGSGIRSP